MQLVDVIIQARMNSTRLPGKVLMPVLGKPLLAYQLERLRLAKRIKSIVLATTIDKADDLVAAFGQEQGIQVYRGSEQDVLDRYYQAARENSFQHIMRVTADCPLIDPILCDAVVQQYFGFGLDYIRSGQQVAEGLDCEVLSFDALERSWKDAKLDFEREHVTAFIRHRSGDFKTGIFSSSVDDSAYRITVDEPEDFEVVKAVLESLYPRHGVNVLMEDVRTFFKEHPEIFALNSDVVRNAARKEAAARGEVSENA